MEGEPPVDADYTVEVEEAELSSEDERAQSQDNSASEPAHFGADRRRPRNDPSPVLDDDDDDVMIEE